MHQALGFNCATIEQARPDLELKKKQQTNEVPESSLAGFLGVQF
jgi:hypothetical protein